MDIVVVSSETIKPSSPTPNHLRQYNLSFLDQIAPPTFMPMVLFFPKPDSAIFDRKQLLDKLKKSLSETLTLYYPLAGQLNDAMACVDCNDAGALFLEAEAVSCRVSDVLQNPNSCHMNSFLAVEIDDARIQEFSVAVQATFFSCGGMIIGLCVSHWVADAASLCMFLNAWSALTRNEAVAPPTYGSAELFPAQDLTGFSKRFAISRENIAAKRFVFENAKISELRDKFKCGDEWQPSRVGALSAFLWHRFTAATMPEEGDDARVCMAFQAVNLRTRMDPPLPDNFFGNLSQIAISKPPIGAGKDQSHGEIAKQMRDSIRAIDGEWVKKFQSDMAGLLSSLKKRIQQVKSGEGVSITFTSLCGFPIYDADFGWGEPVYVCSAKLPFENFFSFLDRKSGNGIEAWIILKEEDMSKLEADQEFLSYTSS